MPENISSKRQFHNRSRSLWQFVLLLIVLVAVTITLVVTCLYQFIHRSDYEINLFQGLVSSSQNTGSTAKSSAVKMTGKNVKDFNFEVSDDENVWTTDTSIELFESSYSNKNGEITVRSADGKNVIAPGTGGSYTFSIQNTGKLNSNYQVWLNADVNVSSSDFPIEFRISGADGWITGDNGAWKTADELNSTVAHKNLYSGKKDEYTLYWRWAFERNADEEDTSYGNAAISQNGSTGNVSGGTMEIAQTVSYTVTLHTLAAEGLIGSNDSDDPGTSDKKDDKNTGEDDQNSGTSKNNGTSTDGTAQKYGTSTSRKAAKTGDNTVIWTWILMAGMAAAFAAVIWNYRKKKTHKGQDV